jgi:replicative DNA helicase
LAASAIQERGYSEEVDVDGYIDQAQQAVFEIANRSNRQSYEPVRRVLHNAIKALELRFSRKQAVTGVATDYLKFDEMTAGFQPGDSGDHCGATVDGKDRVCDELRAKRGAQPRGFRRWCSRWKCPRSR